MDVLYDPIAHVYSVELADGDVAQTVKIDDDHLVDLAEDGSVLSIEVLDPANARLIEIAARFGLADRLDEMLAAIDAAVPGGPPVNTKQTVFISFVKPEIEYAAFTFAHVGLGASQSLPSARPRELTLTTKD